MPAAGLAGAGLLTPLTATLVHSGFVHLLFNLLILLFCGRSVERVLGGSGIVILYLVGAYAAAAAQYPLDPDATVPMVGASGAISAVLGAYAMLFGRNKVKVANPGLAVAQRACGWARPGSCLQHPDRPHLRDERPQDRHRRPYRRLPRRPAAGQAAASAQVAGRLTPMAMGRIRASLSSLRTAGKSA